MLVNDILIRSYVNDLCAGAGLLPGADKEGVADDEWVCTAESARYLNLRRLLSSIICRRGNVVESQGVRADKSLDAFIAGRLVNEWQGYTGRPHKRGGSLCAAMMKP